MASSLGQFAWIGSAALLVDSLTWLSFSPSGLARPLLLEYYIFVCYALCEQELCGDFTISIGVELRGFVCLCGFARMSCLGLPRVFPQSLVCCTARFRNLCILFLFCCSDLDLASGFHEVVATPAWFVVAFFFFMICVTRWSLGY